MKRWWGCFLLVLLVYGVMATRLGQGIPEGTDYYHPLAQRLLQGKFDLPNPVSTQDLSWYQGKWYLPFGPLPAVVLLLIQMFSPTWQTPLVVVTVVVAALAVATSDVVFRRFNQVFLRGPVVLPTVLTLVLALGSELFWVATRPGIWFHAHVYTLLLVALGFLPLMKARVFFKDYALSFWVLAANILVRPTTVLWVLLPLGLFCYDRQVFGWRRLAILGLVVGFWIGLYGGYNWARFGNPWENGFTYHQFNPHYAERVRTAGGWFAWENVPYNAWYMLGEIPRLSLISIPSGRYGFFLEYNPEGNAVWFFTPPLLAAGLALPWRFSGRLRWVTLGLWTVTLLVLVTVLRLSGTGWYQVGYRYVMDVLLPVFLLVMIGVRGKVSGLLVVGSLWAVFVWTLAVTQGRV